MIHGDDEDRAVWTLFTVEEDGRHRGSAVGRLVSGDPYWRDYVVIKAPVRCQLTSAGAMSSEFDLVEGTGCHQKDPTR